MNGPHDLGGQHGFGPVDPQQDEPLFHTAWERRAMAITLAAGYMGGWSIDESRRMRESIPPATYLAASYYEIRIRALEALLIRHGFVTSAELAAGRDLSPGLTPPRVLRAEAVPAMIAHGGPVDRDPGATPPAFAPGARVRTLVMHPATHTRLPRYARGKIGVIEAVQGFHVFPDTNAHGLGEAPQWLYTVVFTAPEIWGRDGDPHQTLSIDAWESYLEPA